MTVPHVADAVRSNDLLTVLLLFSLTNPILLGLVILNLLLR